MKRFDQINMIPFIDIMLVLLAIVLTTASFISQGLIPVDLPKAEQSEPAKGDEKSLEIAINSQNQLFSPGGGQSGGAKINFSFFNSGSKTPILREPLFRNVHSGHNFYSGYHRGQ